MLILFHLSYPLWCAEMIPNSRLQQGFKSVISNGLSPSILVHAFSFAEKGLMDEAI